jgi:excinuclease ABC subunit A
MSNEDCIRIRGARTHNLANIDLNIPRGRMTVITGVSGSGKSSLALDTIFAEGQRQYVESLSVYARQFLDQMERPDVDSIEGLEPTMCIDQRPPTSNPRSTVATLTEIYDFFRVLFSRAGTPYCYKCNTPIVQQSAEAIAEQLLQLPTSTKVMILAPMVRGRKGTHVEVLEDVRKAGLTRVRVDGETFDIDSAPKLDARKNHTIEAVVDRIVLREGVESRLMDSIRLGLKLANGILSGLWQLPGITDAAWQEMLYSTKYACVQCCISYEEVEPRTFSFNSPYGACSECQGIGNQPCLDPELLLPDHELSLSKGALSFWKDLSVAEKRKWRKLLEPFVERAGGDWETSISHWPDSAKKALLISAITDNSSWLHAAMAELRKVVDDEKSLDNLCTRRTCSACNGSRLRKEALAIRIGDMAIDRLVALTLTEARKFLSDVTFSKPLAKIARPLIDEVLKRLRFLEEVGVGYLTLDRSTESLSGGELQRVRLASCIGTGLVGVCYVLDEPSIGLHADDNQRLIDAMRRLQAMGNTLVVVEHDDALMRQSDLLIDMGPGAGRHGGQVVAMGTPTEVAGNLRSLTGRYLSGEKEFSPSQHRQPDDSKWLILEGANLHNLQNVTAKIPLGLLVGVTGVSGSGKSSLINETLSPAVSRHLGQVAKRPGPFSSLSGVEQLDRLIEIDQHPIGRSPRSTPATYAGFFDDIRKVFATTRDAKQRGFDSSRFSFNAGAGRCPKCQGQGAEKIEMNFLPDMAVRCGQCNGKRFDRQTLQVRYKEKNIAEVLEMPVEEAALFFENMPRIYRVLDCLLQVGLGYLPLGQPSTTLSGGEAQRIKLATELARTQAGKTLYLLDEPTTGLHFDDIRRLVAVLQGLVERGNTVVVIEHNLDVIQSCDWLIDLGPEGGPKGGRIVATGSLFDVASVSESRTGRWLKPSNPTNR